MKFAKRAKVSPHPQPSLLTLLQFKKEIRKDEVSYWKQVWKNSDELKSQQIRRYSQSTQRIVKLLSLTVAIVGLIDSALIIPISYVPAMQAHIPEICPWCNPFIMDGTKVFGVKEDMKTNKEPGVIMVALANATSSEGQVKVNQSHVSLLFGGFLFIVNILLLIGVLNFLKLRSQSRINFFLAWRAFNVFPLMLLCYRVIIVHVVSGTKNTEYVLDWVWTLFYFLGQWFVAFFTRILDAKEKERKLARRSLVTDQYPVQLVGINKQLNSQETQEQQGGISSNDKKLQEPYQPHLVAERH